MCIRFAQPQFERTTYERPRASLAPSICVAAEDIQRFQPHQHPVQAHRKGNGSIVCPGPVGLKWGHNPLQITACGFGATQFETTRMFNSACSLMANGEKGLGEVQHSTVLDKEFHFNFPHCLLRTGHRVVSSSGDLCSH